MSLNMKVIVLVAALIGITYAVPAKLDSLRHRSSGYNYHPPPQPSGLYELPTTTTTTTTTTPPPPLVNDYLPPSKPYWPPSNSFSPPASSYIPPSNNYLPPAASVPRPVYKPMPVPAKAEMLMPYEFAYGVNDDQYGTRFSHSANSDGRYVTGEYSVLLPDGRLQVVKFKSNPTDGYTAEVTYH